MKFIHSSSSFVVHGLANLTLIVVVFLDEVLKIMRMKFIHSSVSFVCDLLSGHIVFIFIFIYSLLKSWEEWCAWPRISHLRIYKLFFIFWQIWPYPFVYLVPKYEQICREWMSSSSFSESGVPIQQPITSWHAGAPHAYREVTCIWYLRTR